MGIIKNESMVKYWNMLSKEVMQSLPPEVLKKRDVVLKDMV